MTITEAQIKHIASVNENAVGNNIMFLIAFYEETCQSRGIPPTWENIRVIMQEYKPESIMRKRREYIESTPQQTEEEYKIWQQYKH